LPAEDKPPEPTRASGWTAEKIFAVVGLTFGLALVLATPPFGAPDEHSHLARAYLISEGRFSLPGRATGAEAWIPRSMVTLYGRMAHSEPLRRPRSYRPSEILEHLRQPLAPEQRVQVGFIGTNGPVAYAPQALAVLLGRLWEASPAALLFLGRFANLVCYIALGWFAIARAPLRKWALCLILLTPMALAQAASLSADAPTNALAALFVAWVWRIAFAPGSEVTRRDLIALVLISALLGLTKLAYWPLAALALLIPGDRFRNGPRRSAFCVAVAAAALLPAVFWLLMVRASDPVPISENADAVQQLLFILRQPLTYLAVILNTVVRGFADYARTFVGILGHLNIPLPTVLYAIYPLGILAASLCDPRDPRELSPGRRVGLVGIFLVCGACVFTMSYLGWNPVESPVISGVQGRYFVPALPLLFLALPSAGVPLSLEIRAGGTAALATISLALAVSAVWEAFYS
jgi:hypothetical protein